MMDWACQVATTFEQSAFPGSPPATAGSADASALGELSSGKIILLRWLPYRPGPCLYVSFLC